MPDPKIIANEISYSYADGPAVLRGVSAELHVGRVTGIIGPNGSGKSTLLRLLAGLDKPSTGTVIIQQLTHANAETGDTLIQFHHLASLPPRRRAQRLAYLPQSVAPLFGLTVEDTVALGRFPHASAIGGLSPVDDAAVTMAMSRAGVEALKERIFTELSGGERQRVLLASVLAQEPQFLLLDEPTASLDLHHEAEVFALLAELAREEYGICVVTHDLSLAAAHCDELLLLGPDGNTVAHGAPAEVLTGEALSNAYGASVRVGVHPFTGAPFPYVPPGQTT